MVKKGSWHAAHRVEVIRLDFCIRHQHQCEDEPHLVLFKSGDLNLVAIGIEEVERVTNLVIPQLNLDATFFQFPARLLKVRAVHPQREMLIDTVWTNIIRTAW